jgi:hypothetical protein
LLIYTVPARPTRARAAVWREVKRIGASYLHDGVCILPDLPAARAALVALEARVRAVGGSATLVVESLLSADAADRLGAELQEARRGEYAEVLQAARELAQHVAREAGHHALTRAQRVALLGDLGRIERWLAQIEARDYLGAAAPPALRPLLAACRTALETGDAASLALAGALPCAG